MVEYNKAYATYVPDLYVSCFQFVFLLFTPLNHSPMYLNGSLTDPEMRKNWEEFGNPDGRQCRISFCLPLPPLFDSSNVLGEFC
jgi:hypothetical protein